LTNPLITALSLITFLVLILPHLLILQLIQFLFNQHTFLGKRPWINQVLTLSCDCWI